MSWIYPPRIEIKILYSYYLCRPIAWFYSKIVLHEYKRGALTDKNTYKSCRSALSRIPHVRLCSWHTMHVTGRPHIHQGRPLQQQQKCQQRPHWQRYDFFPIFLFLTFENMLTIKKFDKRLRFVQYTISLGICTIVVSAILLCNIKWVEFGYMFSDQPVFHIEKLK